MDNRLLLIIIFLFNCLWSYGQQDSFDLSEITIVEKLQFDWNKSLREDETVSAQTNRLSDELLFNSGLNFRSYGIGRLTTLRRGGLSGEHTSVKWKGLELKSPLSGVLDFSLVPSFLFSDIKLNNTTHDALELTLINELSSFSENKVKALFSVGQFNQYTFGLQIKKRISQKTSSYLNTYIEESKNNFSYIDGFGIKKKQKNATAFARHLTTGILHDFNSNSRLTLDYWLADTEAEIPATIFQQRATAVQRSKSHRLSLQYKQTVGQFTFQPTAAFLTDHLTYIDPSAKINASHAFDKYKLKLRTSFYDENLGHYKLDISYGDEQAESTNLPKRSHRKSFSLNANWKKYWSKNIVSHLGLNGQWLNGNRIPINGLAQVDWDLSSKSNVSVLVKRIYRLPTLNEQFWLPGGNPDIKSEQGLQAELRYTTKIKKIGIDAVIIYNDIDNTIKWIPQAQVWSPQNVGRIQNIESSIGLSLEQVFGKIKTVNSLNYRTVFSELKKNDAFSFLIDNKQLVYTARHQIKYRNELILSKKLSTDIDIVYTSRIYTLEDHYTSLDPFMLVNFTLNYKTNNQKFNCFLKVKNLTNKTYFLTNGYPMPGIHFQLGFQVELNQKKK